VNDTSAAPPADRTPPLPEEEPLEALLRAITGEIKANRGGDVTSDHGWLYDEETGLPA
jgi:antitoxin VapB